MSESIVQRLFGRFFKPPSDDGAAELALREYASREVAAGFAERDELYALVRDAFEGDVPPSSLDAIPRYVNEAIAAHNQEQLGWPTVTDCDRLDAAFVTLESEGIIARQNFSCCGTCGTSEIGNEIDAAAARGLQVRGYTFYHVQDTEHAVEGHGLYLNYGAVEPDKKSALAVAGRIVEVLNASGLTVEWNGTWEKRVRVEIDWKRRCLR